MTFRALMVMRMQPEDAGTVADIFAEHDATGWPREVGATGRSLFRFHDLYLHLIEADHDVIRTLRDVGDDPAFRVTNERLGHYLRPYSPDWKQLTDSQAELFYSRRWDRP
jgi:hypothetical protein